MWINKEKDFFMKNFVPKNLEEAWVSSDTGIDLYADTSNQWEEPRRMEGPNANMDISDDAILSIIPPPNIKFGANDFEQYVSELIQALPENPAVVFRIFKKTLESHPYLTRKPIGFRGENPYEPAIRKFTEVLSKM